MIQGIKKKLYDGNIEKESEVIDMKMKDIIKKFDEDENKFAKEAVIEAKENKEQITNYLLEYLNEFTETMEKYKDKDCPISIIYSIYLLAEFKEKELFPILIKMFGNEKYNLYKIIGDCVIDRLNSILVSVFNGDFKSINSIIENKKIDVYVRKQFLRCYIYFYDNDMINQEKLEKYLSKLIKLYNYEDDSIYDGILEVIINAHLFNMIPDVKEMFEYDVIDTMIRGGYDSFIDYIFDYNDAYDKFSKIEDTVKEMSWWSFFHENEDDNNIDMEKLENAFKDLIKNDMKNMDVISTNKIGRNDPCPCGSGKKYKKCCIEKEKKFLPYQNYINQSLSKYPKKKEDENKYDLYDFYKEKYIEIDKLIYKVLKRKRIPLYINRDYDAENRIDLEYCNEVLEKIKNILKEENFNTVDDYDEKVSIHYSLYEFFQRYSKILISLIEKSFGSTKDEYLNNLKELIDFFYSNFDLNNDSEVIFLETKYSLYDLENNLDEGIKYFEDKLEKCIPSIKYDVYDHLFDLYMRKYEDISEIEELIEKEKDSNLQKELEKLKLEYLDY